MLNGGILSPTPATNIRGTYGSPVQFLRGKNRCFYSFIIFWILSSKFLKHSVVLLLTSKKSVILFNQKSRTHISSTFEKDVLLLAQHKLWNMPKYLGIDFLSQVNMVNIFFLSDPIIWPKLKQIENYLMLFSGIYFP